MASSPTCPVCGAPTILFTASSGYWTGKSFWGCSRYREFDCPGKIQVAETADATLPVAGASAQARFEKERERRRGKQRAMFPVIAALFVVFIATVFFALSAVHPLLGSAGAIVMGVLSIFVINRLPMEDLYWGVGAQGERKTAEYLEPLIALGFVLLHDRQLPGVRGNIDHIAVGSSGVYVIETKRLSGSVDIHGDTLFVRDHARNDYVNETYREAIGVQIGLNDIFKRLRLTVTPVLCIQGARLPWLTKKEVAGVHLVSGGELRSLIERAPQILDTEQVQEIAHRAAKVFRPFVD